MRTEKTYNGDLMEKGTQNEDIILQWLRTQGKDIIDFREFRLAQRIDVDFGIETIDGVIVLAEIKSDKWISETGNLCFENNRINHFVDGRWFYLGWGWRSPAQKLMVRNPETNITFIFPFLELRRRVAKYISEYGRNMRINITETDKQKTTFNFLIPMTYFKGIYKVYYIPFRKQNILFET
jgi:hypothetical protein